MNKLKKRKDGRYKMSIFIGGDKDGKKQYKFVYGKTQKEVKEKANKVKISRSRVQVSSPAPPQKPH